MYYRYIGDAAQDAADTATAQQQHALALQAYQAKQAGDFATYAQAIQGLYALGIHNVSDANLADMLDIATTPTVDPFAGIEKALFWAALGIGGILLLKRKS